MLGVLLAAAAQLAAPQGDYVWNAYIPGRTVAFGIPDSNQRALRIDCEAREGHLHLFLGGLVNAAVGTTTALEITSRAGLKIFRSWVVPAADGANFSFQIDAHEDLIRTLMDGGSIRISAVGQARTIPGEGAAAVLGPLLKVCAGA